MEPPQFLREWRGFLLDQSLARRRVLSFWAMKMGPWESRGSIILAGVVVSSRRLKGEQVRPVMPGLVIGPSLACGVPKVIPPRAFSSGVPAWLYRLLRPRRAF